MPVHKRASKWHYAFCIRGVRYRGAIPEARTKFEAEKAETKIRQEVYEGRYGRPTGRKDFVTFIEDVYKPWAQENKRSFNTNDKYKLPIICESNCFKGKTFAQISPLLIEKYKKERREMVLENGTRKPSTINRELGLLSKIFSLAIKYGSDPQTTRRYTDATDRAKRVPVEAVRVLREDVCHKSATMQERLPKMAAVSN